MSSIVVSVRVEYKRPITSLKPLAETFSLLSDFERSIPATFPGLENFERKAPGVYRWMFKNINYGGYEIGLSLTTEFQVDELKKIEMVPVAKPGQGSLRGTWTFHSQDSQTMVQVSFVLEMELPLPFFLKGVAESVARKELTKLFDRYTTNVEKALQT